MAHTTFIDQITPVTAEWLNDVDQALFGEGNVLRYLPKAQWEACAAGTTTFDATSYIQQAITAAQNFNRTGISPNLLAPVPVYFPPGWTFKTTTPLHNEAFPVHIRGNGCTIKNSTSNVFEIGLSASPGPEYLLPTIVESLEIFAFPGSVSYASDATRSSYTGIKIRDCFGVTLRDICFWGNSIGLYANGAGMIVGERLNFRTNLIGIYGDQSASAPMSLANHNTFRDCIFRENKKLVEAQGGSWYFYNPEYEANNPLNVAGVRLWDFQNLSGIAGNQSLIIEGAHGEGNFSQHELYLSCATNEKTARISGTFLGQSSSHGFFINNGVVDLDKTTIFNNGGNSVYTSINGVVKDRNCKFQTAIGGAPTNYYKELSQGFQAGDPSGSYYTLGGLNATWEVKSPINNRVYQGRSDTQQFRFENLAGTRMGYFQWVNGANTIFYQDQVYGYEFWSNAGLKLYIGRAGGNSIEPGAANTILCGTGALDWAGGNTRVAFTVTSDANYKKDPRPLEDKEKAVARKLASLIKLFWMKDDFEKSGENAMLHCGLVAQEVEQAFTSEGLDVYKYEMYKENKMPDGSIKRGLIYEQLICFILGGMV